MTVDEFVISMALSLTAFLSAASAVDYQLMYQPEPLMPAEVCIPGQCDPNKACFANCQKQSVALISKPKKTANYDLLKGGEISPWEGWSINKRPLPLNAVYQFTAKWCAPCKQMKPTVVKFQTVGYPIHYVDLDKCPNLAKKMNVGIVPTSVLLINGKIKSMRVGYLSDEELLLLVKQALTASRAKDN